MTKSWSPERRLAQKERARKLYEEGRFGGPGRGQGRKPKRRLQLSMFCPHCGGSLEGLRLDTEGGNVRGSFYTRRAADGTLEIVDMDDDAGFDDVGHFQALTNAIEALATAQPVINVNVPEQPVSAPRKIEFERDSSGRVIAAEEVDTDVLRKGQSVSVVNQRGVVTGFSRDRNHVYVRFSKGARKVPVEDVTPVR